MKFRICHQTSWRSREVLRKSRDSLIRKLLNASKITGESTCKTCRRTRNHHLCQWLYKTLLNICIIIFDPTTLILWLSKSLIYYILLQPFFLFLLSTSTCLQFCIKPLFPSFSYVNVPSNCWILSFYMSYVMDRWSV